MDHPEVGDKLISDYKRGHLAEGGSNGEETSQASKDHAVLGAERPSARDQLVRLGRLWEARWRSQFSILFRRRCAARASCNPARHVVFPSKCNPVQVRKRYAGLGLPLQARGL